MNRIIIVSNRLPVKATKIKNKIVFSYSVGGLATGLSSVSNFYKTLWVGWPGIITNNKTEQNTIRENLTAKDMYPIFLTNEHINKYYYGFSNDTIWPLFHYFPQYVKYNDNTWETYREVNQVFCDKIVEVAKPGDIFWIQDYQLMLLPQLIREKIPKATIGFFLHIPFPSFEMFRSFPWRNEILQGLLGADLIGFHTYDYAHYFMNSVMRLLGYDHTSNNINLRDRIIKIDSFPMGINYKKFANANDNNDVKKEISKLRKKIKNHKIILSIDRLDYSKGISQRLKAFELFLEQNPEYVGKISLFVVVVPSRTQIKKYEELKTEIDKLVGKINGKYGEIDYTPIFYLYRSLPFETMVAVYNIADIALVTPFRDGMNLIAKEYIASKKNNKGVLILSEMAGAAKELGDAIIINPNNINEIEIALQTALSLSEDEQIKGNKAMQNRLKTYDIKRWGKEFLNSLKEIKKLQEDKLIKLLTPQAKQKLISDYSSGKKRLILLDYDGTLVSLASTPEKAIPDDNLLNLLQSLSKQQSNEVVIISGRDKNILQKWFGHLDISLVAEHGAWLRSKNKSWHTIENLNVEWKKDIRPIIKLFVDRTPGSFLEEKEFSLVWHYRKTDDNLAKVRCGELVETLKYFTNNLNLHVLEGDKAIEIKSFGIDKGRAVLQWLSKSRWDFILALGDDLTDEEMFKVLPKKAYSINVGFNSSEAKFNIKSPNDVKHLLTELLKEE
ncbi:MAG: bifunctional alpha,alpha-trehalose-phosphate synthase (UDP-forming)/trehalose-phosphatase [Candidatus Marinimicrobia bacterium]|nr:bifunctional alpha,alpha-trehalose-phosphate synthase (UDP-forming)/trehalose-phosphatase [Candidatus Neomarinimicrobiota bacterium]